MLVLTGLPLVYDQADYMPRPAIKSLISRGYESKRTKGRAKDFQASNDSCKTKRRKTNDSIVLAAKKKKNRQFLSNIYYHLINKHFSMH